MQKLVALGVGFVLLLAACGGDDAVATTTVAVGATTAAPTTTASPTTAPTVETTTTMPAPVTTMASERPVTVHDSLPAARSGAEIPWELVVSDWYLALYSASLVDEPFTEGPTVLYLADPSGNRYEVAGWEPSNAPFAIADWRPDGLAAALIVYSINNDDYEIVEVDLPSGTQLTVHVATSDEYFGSSNAPLEYTRPTGKNFVVYRTDGTSEWIERIGHDGGVLAEVAVKPYDDWDTTLDWLYGEEGTEIIIGGDSLTRVANDGTVLNEMWTPPGELCRPVRWWDDEQVLAACHGDVPSLPHEFYNVLWAIPRSGGVGEPIIEIPRGEIANVYFGYSDAVPWSDPVYLEAGGDCGAGWVEARGDDGVGYRLSGQAGDHGLVDVLADALVLNTWRDCDHSMGELQLTDRDGNVIEYLIPLIGDAAGVIDVTTL